MTTDSEQHSAGGGQWGRLTFAGAIILLAFALGVWRLDVESIWHDEAWSIRAIESPFGTPDDNTPPLYYITLHIFQLMGAGKTPFALRFGSVLIFLPVVALGFRIARRWFGLSAGILAGVLLATSPLLWEYAQEIRAYIVVPLIALALLAGADALLQPRSRIPRRAWVFVLGAELAGLYTHNLSVPLVAWLNVMVIAVWGWRSLRGDVPSRDHLIIWLAAQILLLILYVPWLATQSPSGTTLNTVPAFNAKLSRDLWRGYVFPVVVDPDNLPDSFITVAHIFPVLAGLSIIILLLRNRSLRSALVLSQAVLLPIFSTILLIRASIDFHPRYYILAVPGTLLLFALAAASLPGKMRIAAVLVVAVTAGYITQQSLSLIAHNRQYQHDDFRATAEYYADLPPDTLILIPYEDEPALTHYFAQQLDIQAQFLLMPLHVPPERALAMINWRRRESAVSRIELLTWYQVPADERGMYGCLLAGGSESRAGSFETYGLHTDGYIVQDYIGMQAIDALDGHFTGALQLTGAAYVASPNGLCVQTNWQLVDVPQRANYFASTSLLNPFNWNLTGQSGVIRRDDQAQVGDWDVGDRGSGFTLLLPPEGTPAGNYAVSLRLASMAELGEIDVIDNDSGAARGKSLYFEVSLPRYPVNEPPQELANLRGQTARRQIYAGDQLKLEFLNTYHKDVPLTLVGKGWRLTAIIPGGDPTLVWHTFRIPPDAEGEFDLLLNATRLFTFEIIPVERVFSPPEVELPIDLQVGDVANLTGAAVRQDENTLHVTLVWQALETPDTEYTLFVQVLNADGQLVTGIDVQPQRPITSWIPGEYITDSHTINLDAVNYSGSGTIIVGLYNPISGERLKLGDGSDFITLPVAIEL